MSNGITNITVGRSNGYIGIGTSAIVRGSDVEPTILFDSHSSNADLSRAQAQAIIDALTLALAPPDITFPGYNDLPAAFAAEVNGKRVILCNWLNFKGWEVRRAATYTGETGLLLGWLYEKPVEGSVVATSARVTALPAFEQEFKRKDEALAWLLKVANQ